jgi:hypothetical protein
MLSSEVPGWITLIDLAILKIIASHIPKNTEFVEIGSWVGRSTNALLEGLDPTVKLHAVDIWSTDAMPPENLTLDTCMASAYMPPDSLIYKNYIKAIEIAKESNSWQPAFSYFTQSSNVIQHKLLSNEFKIPDNWSAVFIDGDHSTDQLLKDVLSFLKNDYLDQKLIFGDDFNMKHANTVSMALLTALSLYGNMPMYTKRRFLLRFPKSDLWFMWPTVGYWYDKLPAIIAEVNDAIDKVKIFPESATVQERGEHPTAYLNSILPKS